MIVFVLQKLLSLLALSQQNLLLLCNCGEQEAIIFVFFFLVRIQRARLCACSKSSSPCIVYLCGRITAPHTGLAYILHRFQSVSVVSCVRRYFLRRRRVFGIFFQNEEKKYRIGNAPASCGRGLKQLKKIKDLDKDEN